VQGSFSPYNAIVAAGEKGLYKEKSKKRENSWSSSGISTNSGVYRDDSRTRLARPEKKTPRGNSAKATECKKKKGREMQKGSVRRPTDPSLSTRNTFSNVRSLRKGKDTAVKGEIDKD